MPGGIAIAAVVAALALVVWAWRTARAERRNIEDSRRLAAADERRVRALLNGAPPLERRASTRNPPRSPPR